MENKEFELDSCVKSVIKSFEDRAEFGFKKYGTNLDRTDLTQSEWLQHAIEEGMDFILYLTRVKQIIDGQKEINRDRENNQNY